MGRSNVDVLRLLKAETVGLTFLFLTGDSDAETPTLCEDLNEIFGGDTDGVTIVEVAGGGHSVWKKLAEEEFERVKGEVNAFLLK